MFKLIVLVAFIAAASAVAVHPVASPYGAYGYPYGGYHAPLATPYAAPYAAPYAGYHAPLAAAYHAPLAAPIVAKAAVASPVITQTHNSVVHTPSVVKAIAPAYPYAAPAYHAPLAAAYHAPLAAPYAHAYLH